MCGSANTRIVCLKLLEINNAPERISFAKTAEIKERDFILVVQMMLDITIVHFFSFHLSEI